MNGLDPAGILEFRHLIRSLVDEGRTVMLSSHILDEVEKTCDQVAIVDQGEIVAMGSLEELRGGGRPRVLIGVDGADEALRLLADAPRSRRGGSRRRRAPRHARPTPTPSRISTGCSSRPASA